MRGRERGRRKRRYQTPQNFCPLTPTNSRKKLSRFSNHKKVLDHPFPFPHKYGLPTKALTRAFFSPPFVAALQEDNTPLFLCLLKPGSSFCLSFLVAKRKERTWNRSSCFDTEDTHIDFHLLLWVLIHSHYRSCYSLVSGFNCLWVLIISSVFCSFLLFCAWTPGPTIWYPNLIHLITCSYSFAVILIKKLVLVPFHQLVVCEYWLADIYA